MRRSRASRRPRRGGIHSTPAQFNSFIRAEMDKYTRLIKEANIKVNP